MPVDKLAIVSSDKRLHIGLSSAVADAIPSICTPKPGPSTAMAHVDAVLSPVALHAVAFPAFAAAFSAFASPQPNL